MVEHGFLHVGVSVSKFGVSILHFEALDDLRGAETLLQPLFGLLQLLLFGHVGFHPQLIDRGKTVFGCLLGKVRRDVSKRKDRVFTDWCETAAFGWVCLFAFGFRLAVEEYALQLRKLLLKFFDLLLNVLKMVRLDLLLRWVELELVGFFFQEKLLVIIVQVTPP